MIKVVNNVGCQLRVAEGDVEKGFRESDVVIERTYETNRRYHNQLENKSAIVRPEPDGG
ncbi:molybdopterin-dependent oxidoreductase, partial [Candidatus Bathyarchaeota archaeon]|nr:molybdopterin-dependent oxidoreductase [Candidatus Bathyarchaeota archaeon]NIV67811.1 molybdopterin-dependent oxidoreductase [Candidatus Bathyarchaeota archaeon]